MNKGTINLESKRLILRKIELSDYKDIFNVDLTDSPEEIRRKVLGF